jgi:hypothetical protein
MQQRSDSGFFTPESGFPGSGFSEETPEHFEEAELNPRSPDTSVIFFIKAGL